MPFLPLQPSRLRLRGSGALLASDAGQSMAPRDPDPLPEALAFPHNGPVEDFGVSLNLSTAVSPFTHGLAGVNQAANTLFADVLIISFCGLLLVTLVYRWLHMGNSQVRHMLTMGREADQRYWMHNQSEFWPKVKRNLLYAPLFRNRHNKEIQLSQAVSIGTLPSRFHSVLLFVYLASNIAYCLVLDWGKESASVIAEMRGRSGVLATLNLIPTVLFALRNNPLIPILRVSYDTFNLLHRWCARMVVLESIVHVVMWAVNDAKEGGIRQVQVSLATSTSYTWGMVGASIFTFVVLVSTGPVRHAAYEIFLNGHRVMVAVALAGVYVHLDAANLPQWPWIVLCLALWSGEWALRLCRIIYHNWSRKRGFTKVTVEWLPAEACRVTFELARPWKWKPGCHVHAYIPAIALWSSHPFSVAWVENISENASMEFELEKMPPVPPAGVVIDSGGRSQHPNLVTRASHHVRKSTAVQATATTTETKHEAEDIAVALPRDRDVTSLSLIMRARTGMTRQLYNKMVKRDRKPLVTWGAIEGAYGGHDSLSSYGTVILFAGGVGITHCVGYIHHLMLQYQAGTCSTRKILLVWSVPNTESLEWVRVWMDQILRMEGRRDVLRIQLFVTKPRHRGEVISSTGSVQMFPGRCNPQTVIEREMTERIGSVGVTVCGPGAFADSVRSACRSVVETASLDFVEEAFTY